MSASLRETARTMGGLAGLAGIALISGCLKTTAPQPSSLQLAGSWNYTGVQISPVPETLSGTLVISLESGTSFSGQLVVETINLQTGVPTSLSGTVSGTESNIDVIDFDADLPTGSRRHVGRIVADTITGTWVGSPGAGTMPTGTFRLERETR